MSAGEREPGDDARGGRRTLASRVRAIAKRSVGERAGVTASLFCALLGLGLCFGSTPLWWFGGSILLASLTALRHEYATRIGALRERADRPRSVLGLAVRPYSALLESSCLLVIAAIASVMMAEILGGERPVSHDHTVHYFKAWQLHRYFLPEGRLFGWSHRFFAGYPVNYLYPPGTDLWVNVVYGLSLGALSFSHAYGVAFWLFHVLTGVAGYYFGKQLGGRVVGLITGVLLLSDLSQFRLGGWAYTIEYGVWPQALSLNFGLLAVCRIRSIVEHARASSIGWFALWTGLAIITHPAALIFLVILLLVVPVAAALSDHVKAPGALARLSLAALLSLGVASLWLIPFLSSRAETYVMGVWWDTTYEIAKGVLALDAFGGSLPQVLAFAVLALVVMLRSRRFLLLFSALMALVVPAVSNSTFIDEFHLPQLASSFTKIQYMRMSTMVKPFWFALAGYFVVGVARFAPRLAFSAISDESSGGAMDAGKDPRLRSVMLVLLTSLLVLPFAVPTAEAFWTQHVRKALTTESDRPLVEDRRDLVRWLKESLPRDDGFYRLGVFMGHNHDLLDLAAELDVPVYKRGFTPATNFIYKMKEHERSIFEAVNLRYAISKRHEPESMFEMIASFGRYRVYEFRFWRPEPFTVIEGHGDVKLERFSDEEIVVRAAQGSKGTLRMNVSYFSRWHAYRDGERVPITLTYLREAPEETGFITVDLEPGQYRFVFERSIGDRLAPWTSALCVLCAIALIAGHRERRIGARVERAVARLGERCDRLSSPRLRKPRRVVLWICLIALFALGIGLSEWRPAIELEELPRVHIDRVRFDFLENLSRARVDIEYPTGNQPCVRQGARHVCRDSSGNLSNERYVASTPANIVEYQMVRCIRARPEQNALLSIRFPRVPLADAIVGYYGIERAGRLLRRRRPVDLTIMVDGEKLYDDRTREDNKMHWFHVPTDRIGRDRADVVFSVKAVNVSKRFFCFHAQAVDLE